MFNMHADYIDEKLHERQIQNINTFVNLFRLGKRNSRLLLACYGWHSGTQGYDDYKGLYSTLSIQSHIILRSLATPSKAIDKR